MGDGHINRHYLSCSVVNTGAEKEAIQYELYLWKT
jgi:hypothetical protein